MRHNTRAFVEIAAETLGLSGPVYEFGAYQVDSQEGWADLRSVFAGQRYVGCDMRRGLGVDRVEDLANLSLDDGVAQTIVCIDTLEHVFEVRRAVDEMFRVLAPGGTILVSVPFEFPIHCYPDDYWRLTPGCLLQLLSPLSAAVVGCQGGEPHPHTVFGIGMKGPLDTPRLAGVEAFMDRFQSWLTDARAATPWYRLLKDTLRAPFLSKGQRRRNRDWYQARFALELPDALSTPLIPVTSRRHQLGAKMR